MRAVVDQEGCIGCGLCEQVAPEVFELRGGVSEVITGDVAVENELEAKDAATQCPVSVIHIEE